MLNSGIIMFRKYNDVKKNFYYMTDILEINIKLFIPLIR